MSVLPAWSSGSVVDAGSDAFRPFLWVGSASHDQASAVVTTTVWLFSVMFASLAEFTVFVPGVLR